MSFLRSIQMSLFQLSTERLSISTNICPHSKCKLLASLFLTHKPTMENIGLVQNPSWDSYKVILYSMDLLLCNSLANGENDSNRVIIPLRRAYLRYVSLIHLPFNNIERNHQVLSPYPLDVVDHYYFTWIDFSYFPHASPGHTPFTILTQLMKWRMQVSCDKWFNQWHGGNSHTSQFIQKITNYHWVNVVFSIQHF